MTSDLRLAWFSPLPPTRSGIAAYSADLLPLLGDAYKIDCYVDRPSRAPSGFEVFNAHDFVWKQRRQPYDLVVYQLGNATYHDYMWAYLARYPGLAVLHDARLHQARARRLLNQERFDDYREEFWYDHPDAVPDFAEYAVVGLGGSIYYFWSMLRVVVRTARGIAVHNERVAAELGEQFPGSAIETIRMGVPPCGVDEHARRRIRQELALPDDAFVFAAFGKVTPEKRIRAILDATSALAGTRQNVYLLLVGDAADYGKLHGEIARLGIADRVRLTGYVADEAIDGYLSAADACLCLRWPTAHETSASWLRCLAASRPTIISDLAHLVDIPTIDPRTWMSSAADPVAIAIDLLDEERALRLAMDRLATDRDLARRLGRAAGAYWAAHHTMTAMASDYRRTIDNALSRPAPVVRDLPAHFSEDCAEPARELARRFGVSLDILPSS